jgi:hypothetical protein
MTERPFVAAGGIASGRGLAAVFGHCSCRVTGPMVAQETGGSSVLVEPALLARHTAAVKLLRRGREVDGMLLLSYVVWPSPNLDAAHAVAGPRSASTAEGWRPSES